MKTLAGAAAALLLLLVGATCGYAEWTGLRCVRCGTWGVARQLRLGPDVLLPYADWAQHSIALATWRLERLPARDRKAVPALPAAVCSLRGHLWIAEQSSIQGLVRSGSCGFSSHWTGPLTRGIEGWSDPGFQEFCRRSVTPDRLAEIVLPGDEVFSGGLHRVGRIPAQ